METLQRTENKCVTLYHLPCQPNIKIKLNPLLCLPKIKIKLKSKREKKIGNYATTIIKMMGTVDEEWRRNNIKNDTKEITEEHHPEAYSNIYKTMLTHITGWPNIQHNLQPHNVKTLHVGYINSIINQIKSQHMLVKRVITSTCNQITEEYCVKK